MRKIGWIRDLCVALKAAREVNMTELVARTRSTMELLVCSLRPEIWRKGGVKKWARDSREINSRREMTDERSCLLANLTTIAQKMSSGIGCWVMKIEFHFHAPKLDRSTHVPSIRAGRS